MVHMPLPQPLGDFPKAIVSLAEKGKDEPISKYDLKQEEGLQEYVMIILGINCFLRADEFLISIKITQFRMKTVPHH